MYKAAVNRCLLITAMMASSFSNAENEASNVSTDDITAMDGMFSSEFDSGFEADWEIPVVLTAARLRQSQLDAPASVTVIEAETIQALGFKDIEEIFRLVPGMLVAYHSGVSEKTASVSYHGTNLPEHRRLQVLIDGRSVYKPGLARVEWADIPLAVEDIARIEVIRGPNSAAYGANSYLGTINIMTKHPQSEKGVTVKVTGGMRDVKNTYVNIAESIGTTEVRWTLGSKQKSGFDVDSTGKENRDSIDAVFTTLSTFTPLTPHFNMEWQAGYKTGENQQRELLDDAMSYDSPEDIDAEDIFVWSKLNIEYSESQFSHVQIYNQFFDRVIDFSGCIYPGVDVAYDVELVCGDFNKSLTETKTEIEFQHTSLWNQNLRTVAGARIRLDEFDSETYNDGYTKNFNKSLFSNIEYRILDTLLMNAGGMYETDNLNGEYFSPRLAFNFQPTSLDTIRIIFSEAIRSPDLFEQNGQLIFTIRNARLQNDGPLGVAGTLVDDQIIEFGVEESELDFETIKSREISYFGIYPAFNAQVDIKVFYDELRGLISEGLGHDVELTNSNKLDQHGIEGQLKVKLSTKDSFALSFSYLDSDDDFASNKDENGELTYDAEQESSLSADRSGSLSWIHSFNRNTVLGTAYYHVENWNTHATESGYTFSRLDMNIRHKIMITNDLALTLQAAMQYRFDDDPLGRSRNNYVDDHFLYGSAQVNF